MSFLHISDAHVDLPYMFRQMGFRGPWRDLEKGDLTLEEAKKAGLIFLVVSIYLEDSFNGPESMDHFNATMAYVEPLLEDVDVLNRTNSSKIKNGKIKAIFSIENADFLSGQQGLLEDFRQKGILIVGLTHAGANRLADGNNVRYGNGITKEGYDILKAMEREGLILDLSHLNEKCFNQALDIFGGHLMVTHTGLREIYDIPRNIDLKQAKEIVDRDGIIGISINPELMWEDKGLSIDRVYATIDTLVGAFGPSRVCLGSDVCGFFVENFSYSEALAELTEILLKRGYGSAISEIFYTNLINFIEKHI